MQGTFKVMNEPSLKFYHAFSHNLTYQAHRLKKIMQFGSSNVEIRKIVKFSIQHFFLEIIRTTASPYAYLNSLFFQN